MSTQNLTEMVGYIGSTIVLVSFLMTSVFKLRVVNTAGSLIFMVYALIIKSYPTAIMNLCLALINIRFLWKMRHTGRQYELAELRPDDGYMQYLLAAQQDDIRSCFPDIDLKTGISPNMDSNISRKDDRHSVSVDRCFLVTCQKAPAGIMLGQDKGEGTLDLLLDYSLPEYRDFSIGKFLTARLKEKGYRRLIYHGPDENHKAYLEKTGFERKSGSYEKML